MFSKFSEKHEALLQSGRSVDSPALLSVDTGLKENRLRFFDRSTGLFKLICHIMSFQESLDAVADLNGAELQRFQLDHDPTLMSHLFYQFERIIQALLSANEFPGLPSQDLAAFKEVYGSGGFKCRFRSCSAGSYGFPTVEKRAEHEKAAHAQRYPCTDVDCPYTTIGFTTATSLKKHLQEYHSPPAHAKIPDIFRHRISENREQSVQGVDSNQLMLSPQRSNLNEPEFFNTASVMSTTDRINFFDNDFTPPAYLDWSANATPEPFNILDSWPPMHEEDSRTSPLYNFREDDYVIGPSSTEPQAFYSPPMDVRPASVLQLSLSGNQPSPTSNREWMAMVALEMESHPINKRKLPNTPRPPLVAVAPTSHDVD
ncbi:hypothetical protein SLS56_010593 [Neofusicoccum ribis]|uniref:C2H2-type domain-containing protein n=1 Tax=Neofusicoccum ribis TaxID=45134 RepID=A0ABR3SDZ7_9PEZI